jgi:hypothetical protein
MENRVEFLQAPGGVPRANGSYSRYSQHAGPILRRIVGIKLNRPAQVVDHFEWEGRSQVAGCSLLVPGSVAFETLERSGDHHGHRKASWRLELAWLGGGRIDRWPGNGDIGRRGRGPKAGTSDGRTTEDTEITETEASRAGTRPKRSWRHLARDRGIPETDAKANQRSNEAISEQ